jgi:uncharacterized repeat protein (TIGR01451 family)
MAFLPGSYACADGTAAGTVIDNTAQVDFDLAGTRISLNSNTVSVLVDERIDVLVTLLSPQTQVNAGDLDRSLLFSVTNTGNGSEAFQLSIDSILGGDDFDPVPSVPAIYFDSDASGDFSPGDVAYVPGSNEPLIAADETINILLLNGIPAGVIDGNVGRSEFAASALTGAGSAGDVLANQGDGGVDAVIGTSGGAANGVGEYVVGDVVLSILKSVVVVDPFGGSEAVPGATLNYTITVEVTNSGTAVDSIFTDPVPANTSYVVSSISLNGGGLTDATDGDSGELDASGVPTVVVRLGDLTQADGLQTVSFQVTID